MGDSTTNVRQINNQIQEISIERTKTLTYGVEDLNLRAEEFLSYITTLKLAHHVACVQKFTVGNLTMLEVTCETPFNKDQLQKKIFEARIMFNNQPLKEYSNRELKAIQKVPVIKVMIFEAPFELDSFYIRQKLQYYGKLKDQEVYRHKYRGLEIYNGIRSINFLSLNKPLPTNIYVQGNRIKLKHIGQDRSPICAICKVKGHYRTECPKIQDHKDMNEEEAEEQHNQNEEMTEEQREMEERFNHDPAERTEEERKEEQEKFPKSSWVDDSNKLWEEEMAKETTEEENEEVRRNGTCLTPTQKDTEWTEVKRKKEGKEPKKKTRKKKKDLAMENRFDSLEISQSSDESTNKKKRRCEPNEDNEFHEKYGYNKLEDDTETDLDIDLTSTDEPYLSPDDEEKKDKI